MSEIGILIHPMEGILLASCPPEASHIILLLAPLPKVITPIRAIFIGSYIEYFVGSILSFIQFKYLNTLQIWLRYLTWESALNPFCMSLKNFLNPNLDKTEMLWFFT